MSVVWEVVVVVVVVNSLSVEVISGSRSSSV